MPKSSVVHSPWCIPRTRLVQTGATALVLIAGLALVDFVAHRGSQPMQLANADWSQPRSVLESG